ncbi:MAG TPA: phosphatase PAP2 family protein [Sphingobacterium sp.]|nr:phosphatase PAP2 family protein [Sphingobacterium sp.]
MNNTVIRNYAKLKFSLLYVPVLLLIFIALSLYSQGALSMDAYRYIQKDGFMYLNANLSQLPGTQYNLTQLGDTLIALSFLTIFVLYAPKLWEALISGLLVSLLLSVIPKKIFEIPRPAATFDRDSFVIIGKTLSGHNSFPSGHTITIFTTLTILMFAFMPQTLKLKILWCFCIILIGLILGFTRVGVGAHYPLDVVVGSIIGYISGLLGIFIAQKYRIWAWVGNKKSYPFFILLFAVCCAVLVNKIMHDNLIIFYLSIISLISSLYIVTKAYVKK